MESKETTGPQPSGPYVLQAGEGLPGFGAGTKASRASTNGSLTLIESRVERLERTVRLTHLFGYGSRKAHLLTNPFEGYS